MIEDEEKKRHTPHPEGGEEEARCGGTRMKKRNLRNREGEELESESGEKGTFNFCFTCFCAVARSFRTRAFLLTFRLTLTRPPPRSGSWCGVQ